MCRNDIFLHQAKVKNCIRSRLLLNVVVHITNSLRSFRVCLNSYNFCLDVKGEQYQITALDNGEKKERVQENMQTCVFSNCYCCNTLSVVANTCRCSGEYCIP